MRLITDVDHWSQPVERWRGDGQQLFRLLTLLCHWRECERRRESAGLATRKEPADVRSVSNQALASPAAPP
jgi:hypothetical protein